jgi:hypothetical protein
MDLTNIVINRGSILYSGEFENIDHGKFFVIIGEDDSNYVGYFFINSNINFNINNKLDFYRMQMTIKRSDYSFLKYDSFIDCHQLSTISKNILANQINTRKTKFIEILKVEDIGLLLENLRASDLYTEKEKESFFR